MKDLELPFPERSTPELEAELERGLLEIDRALDAGFLRELEDVLRRAAGLQPAAEPA